MSGFPEHAAPWPVLAGEMAARVRDTDWAATPLGPSAGWPAALRAVVELVLASPTVATVAYGEARRLIYNDAAAVHYGARQADALGRPLAEAFADGYPAVAGFYDRAFAGESVVVRAQPLPIDDPGQMFDAYLTPVRDDGGTVIAVHMIGLEVGDRHRAERELRESEQRFRAFVTASSDVVYRMNPDWTEMRELKGRSFLRDTAAPIRNWTDTYIHPDDQVMVRSVIDRATRLRSVFALEHRVIRADGTLGWTASRAVPVLAADGTIREWLGTASDITARREAEAARERSDQRLRDSERRYRTLFDAMDQGFCIIELLFDADGRPNDYRYIQVNAAFAQQTGLSNVVGRRTRALMPDQEQRWFDIYGRIDATGTPQRFEQQAAALGHWYEVFAFPLGDPGQHRLGVLFNDIGARKAAEGRLRATQMRQHFLLRLSDALRPIADPQSIQGEACRLLAEQLDVDRAYYVRVDEEAGTAAVGNDFVRGGLPSLAGEHRIGDFAWSVAILRRGECHVITDTQTSPLVPAAGRPACAALHIRACMGAPLIKDGRLQAALCVTASQPRDWRPDEVELLHDVGERIWSAVERAQVEAALRDREDRLQVLVGELQHRVRNMLTVVRSVFSRTAEAGGDLDDVADHFRGRLDALARTQVVTTQSASGLVDLENLIRDELLSVGATETSRVTVEGPEVALNATAAESIGLAIHELTTNALKYGALKVPNARLSVRWRINMDYGVEPRLILTWLEQGVPAISVRPARRGFGSELIEEALPYRLGADTELEFRGGGVCCTISMPLAGDEAI